MGNSTNLPTTNMGRRLWGDWSYQRQARPLMITILNIRVQILKNFLKLFCNFQLLIDVTAQNKVLIFDTFDDYVQPLIIYNCSKKQNHFFGTIMTLYGLQLPKITKELA